MTKSWMITLATVLACAGCASGSEDEPSDEVVEETAASEAELRIGAGCTADPRVQADAGRNWIKASFVIACAPAQTVQYAVCIDRLTSTGWRSVSCNGWLTHLVGPWLSSRTTYRETSGLANGTYRGRLSTWTAAIGWRSTTTGSVNL